MLFRAMDSMLFLLMLVSVAAGCDDIRDPFCTDWKKDGYCDPSSPFFSFMSRSCRKTCGLCVNPPPSLPPLSCFDRSTYCASYAPYCTDLGYVDYLKKECKRTCNYCHITTAPPPTTLPTQPYTGAAGRALQPGCGHKGPGHTRIVGGTNSKPGDWPWQVNIDYEYNYSNRGNWCGGTLINDEWIVSAAHCFNDDPVKKKYWLKLGEHDLKTNSTWEQKFEIAELILHPQYDAHSNHDYDLAMIRINKKVKFNARIRPACIPEHNTDFPVGEDCYISGWGALKESGGGPAILQQAKVPLVARDVCQKSVDGRGYTISSRMICAGYSTGAIDSCQGDSGGPLVCKKRVNNQDVWYLWGATSWGVGCARKGLYGVYANTKGLSGWVTKIAFGV